MSSYSANTRVLIPSSIRKMIQDIKEISRDHSDEDVYAMLKECSMDPNETAHRLLFLDTFHEVKRKRDKRKEIVNGKVFETSRRKAGNQIRGARSGRGSFSSQHTSNDAGGERVAAVLKENGSEDNKESILRSPDLPVLKEVETKTLPLISKTSSTPVNGHISFPNGALSNGHVVQCSETGDTIPPYDIRDASLMPASALPQSKENGELVLSAADPSLVPMRSCDSRISIVAGAIRCEGKNHELVADLKDSTIAEKDLCNSREFANQSQTNEHGSGKVDASEVSSSRSETTEHINVLQPKMNGESLDSGKLSFSPVPDTASAVESSLLHDAGQTKAVQEVTTKFDELKFAEVQHVIFPNHIQVPDAVKNVLSFGSLDARFGVGVTDLDSSVSNKNSNQSSEELEDESAKQPESCDEGSPPPAVEEKYPDSPQAPLNVPETIPHENNVPAPKDDQLNQEASTAVGPPYPVVHATPTYGFGFMPPMLGSPLVQIEGLDHQSRLLRSMIGNSLAMPASAPTPPPMQSAAAAQSSVAVSTQSLPLIRHPYPPNFIPYYLPPYFMPPTLQFLGHGIPPQLPIGNMCFSPAAAASGVKVPPPFKPGTSSANQVPLGMPSGAFGVYNALQAGYNPNAVVTSASSNAYEDVVPSVLKESNMYLGQQSEGSTVWNPAPGRESPTLTVNPFFNLPQNQHATISQSGHGPFAAAYHPYQTIAAPTAAQFLVQQSESMAGPVESAGLLPPSNSFEQQPQRQLVNWSSGF